MQNLKSNNSNLVVKKDEHSIKEEGGAHRPYLP